MLFLMWCVPRWAIVGECYVCCELAEAKKLHKIIHGRRSHCEKLDTNTLVLAQEIPKTSSGKAISVCFHTLPETSAVDYCPGPGRPLLWAGPFLQCVAASEEFIMEELIWLCSFTESRWSFLNLKSLWL